MEKGAKHRSLSLFTLFLFPPHRLDTQEVGRELPKPGDISRALLSQVLVCGFSETAQWRALEASPAPFSGFSLAPPAASGHLVNFLPPGPVIPLEGFLRGPGCHTGMLFFLL